MTQRYYMPTVQRATNVSSAILSASGTGVAFKLAPDDGKQVVAVILNFSGVGGTPSMEICIETNNNTVSGGQPSGTLLWSGAQGNYAVSASLGWKRFALPTPGVWPAGTIGHVVIAPPSAGNTFSATHSITINRGLTGMAETADNTESSGTAASGLTTNGGRSNISAMASVWANACILEYSDGTYYCGGSFGAVATSSLTNLNASSSHIGGLKFQLPERAYFRGCKMYLSRANTASGPTTAPTFKLYDASNNVLATIVSAMSGTEIGVNGTLSLYDFAYTGADIILAANTVYRAVLTGTQSATVYYNLVGTPTASTSKIYNNALLPNAGAFQGTVSTNNGSAWTDDPLVIPMIFMALETLPGGPRAYAN